MIPIRRLTKEDLSQLRQFWIDFWGGEQMFMHGQVVRYDQVEGFVYGDWIGLLTYVLRGDECEITSLNSLQEGRGIGAALIDKVILEAKEQKCRRVCLITTNDNLHALGFYQKRGFELAAVHRGAVNESRKRKPSIPFIGQDGIPLRDEIELEMVLSF
jgi:GNAT superfamily N-acetyltransferase